ncbi:MAG: M20 family metallopeptidase [Planctomycetes bacterium]|nr:M20 family metallopeptidase [Planctomycetota bacterium]
MRRLTTGEQQQLRDLLAKLVSIDSVNRNLEEANRDRAEERIAAFVAEHMRSLGMAVEVREFQPGRPNLIGHWPDQGDAGAGSLMISAHMDTVTVEGMTVEPFEVAFRDGRAYGRGACDTKGSLATFLTALAIARREDALPAERVYFVATVSEETGCQGATALMQTGFRTDAAIVGEPTCCQVVASHKGPLWLTVETRGKPCHASYPELGVNAIDMMARVVQFVHGPWQERIRRTRHPLLGTSTMSVTIIEGGSKVNIIPAVCRAQIDGRFVPGEATDVVVADFSRMLAEHLGSADGFAIVRQETYPPLNCPPDRPICCKLLDLCRQASGQTAPLGVNYFADTGPFDQAGIDAVLFGPGDIAQAHTADEFVDLDQLDRATEILLTLLTDHAGRPIL